MITNSNEVILSEAAKVYNHQGYLACENITVAVVDKEYIRVGSCLYFRNDLIESEDKLECLCYGSTIVL